MKANPKQMAAALDAPPANIRLFLLYGPDEAEARALAQRLERAMGAEADRIDLDGPTLKADPARLADEAASMSLFGGRRWMRAAGTGDELAASIDALLTAPEAGNPVVALIGNAKETHALVKRALADPAVMACRCFQPSPAEVESHVTGLARASGMRLGAELARQIARAAGYDRGLAAQEVEKLALYLDAAPERPREASQDALDAIGAGEGEADLSRLINAVLEGRGAQAADEAARLAQDGVDGIGLVRAFKGRIQLLNRLAPLVASGGSAQKVVEDQGNAIFYKERQSVTRQLGLWPPAGLARVNVRMLAAERAVKAHASAGPVLVASELIQIARAAARAR